MRDRMGRAARSGLLPLLLVVASVSIAAASPFVEAAERLDGLWRGEDGFVLRVDSQRAQASVDAERPFQWQRFLVKEVEADAIVFSIGAELYEARVDGESLVLSGTSFRGERALRLQAVAAEP